MKLMKLTDGLKGIPHIKDIEQWDRECGGAVYKVHLDNGYTASLACHAGSYGGKEGLFEGAVQYNRECVYDTPITSNVENWLTPVEAIQFCAQVAMLPPRDE